LRLAVISWKRDQANLCFLPAKRWSALVQSLLPAHRSCAARTDSWTGLRKRNPRYSGSKMGSRRSTGAILCATRWSCVS